MIPRHELPHPDMIDYLIGKEEENAKTLIENLTRDRGLLGMGVSDELMIASRKIAMGHDRQEILQRFQNAVEMAIAHFTIAMDPHGGPGEWTIGGETVTIHSVETKSYMDHSVWLNSFYVALIMRNRNLIDLLLTVPDALLEQANAKGSPFHIAMVSFCKGLYDDDTNIAQLLTDVMDAASHQGNNAVQKAYASRIAAPSAGVFRYILSGNSEKFNAELEVAILEHQSYYTSGDRFAEYRGWVSIPLIASASLAFESDIEVTVESDYVPLWLVKGQF